MARSFKDVVLRDCVGFGVAGSGLKSYDFNGTLIAILVNKNGNDMDTIGTTLYGVPESGTSSGVASPVTAFHEQRNLITRGSETWLLTSQPTVNETSDRVVNVGKIVAVLVVLYTVGISTSNDITYLDTTPAPGSGAIITELLALKQLQQLGGVGLQTSSQ